MKSMDGWMGKIEGVEEGIKRSIKRSRAGRVDLGSMQQSGRASLVRLSVLRRVGLDFATVMNLGRIAVANWPAEFGIRIRVL